MNDTTLRETYARLMSARRSDRRECPSPEVILALATAASHDDRSAVTFDHVMGCEACVAEYELLRSVHVAGQPKARAEIRRWAPLALAASALLIVGVATTVMRSNEQMRGTTSGVATAELSQVRRGDSLRLAWPAVSGADAYRVEVLDSQGELLGDATTGDTTVAFGPDVIPRSATEVDWLLVTRRADGNEQRAPLRRVRIVP